MTVVESTTGEVVNIASADVARRLVEDIGTAVATSNRASGRLIEAIAEAMRLKAWIGAGYGSWENMVDGEGWEIRPATTEDRAALAEVFRSSGMSLRAIGKVLHASPQTIGRDTADVTVPNGTVVGLDGIERPATQPERELAEGPTASAPGASAAQQAPTPSATPSESERDAAVTAAAREISRTHALFRWKPEELVALNDPDIDAGIRNLMAVISPWWESYKAAKPKGLVVHQGGKQ